VLDVSSGLESMARFIDKLGSRDMLFLVPCSGRSSSIDEFIRTCSYPVHLLMHPDLRYHQPEAIAGFIRTAIDSGGSSFFVMTDTMRGASTASFAAARSGIAFIPRVTGISADADGYVFDSRDDVSRTTRKITPVTDSAVLTLSSCFQAVEDEKNAEGSGIPPEIICHDATYRYHPVSLSRSVSGSDLANARVIVAAGRGIGSGDNLKLVSDIVSLLPDSAIAASRPVCDAGWLPLSCQVGMTGQTVHPGLYIACGISGSAQHLAGMKDSECIVSINTDPDAPICSIADYCVVEDLTVFLPDLKRACMSIISPEGDINKVNGSE